MLSQIAIENILFLDIETIPQYPDYNQVPDDFKKFWERKCNFLKKEKETPGELYSRAGIYAEFGQIICISAGYITLKDGNIFIRIKSFYGEAESDFLPGFIEMINQLCSNRNIYLCAHNGKEFDFPYLARRILINGYKIPSILNVAGKKPWEVNFLDTMELWKFGDYKHFTSLDLLTRLFGIPTPKNDMDGSMVAEVYYKENDLTRIVKYCERDVLAVAQLYLKYLGEDIIPDENVEIVD
ncbi:MAG: 3'-5' exonuclease [Bacteroidales bacterium]|nr:3'-5' exonuclease [Bacteroidales bacterium]